ncbi:uncharacterized protein DS421_13g424050 [Arachis hypogaea]|nr:uncharacterized protein DS421_13g424050 [Arachis hypogaea]
MPMPPSPPNIQPHRSTASTSVNPPLLHACVSIAGTHLSSLMPVFFPSRVSLSSPGSPGRGRPSSLRSRVLVSGSPLSPAPVPSLVVLSSLRRHSPTDHHRCVR